MNGTSLNFCLWNAKHLFSRISYASSGSISGINAGSGSFMLSVVRIPTSAQIAGTRPSPYLVTENEKFWWWQLRTSGAEPAQREKWETLSADKSHYLWTKICQSLLECFDCKYFQESSFCTNEITGAIQWNDSWKKKTLSWYLLWYDSRRHNASPHNILSIKLNDP